MSRNKGRGRGRKPSARKNKKGKAEGQALKIFLKKPGKAYSYNTVLKRLSSKVGQEIAAITLQRMIKSGKIRKQGEKLSLGSRPKSESKNIEAFLDMNKRGSAYAVPVGEGDDIFIDVRFLNRALDKDRVSVQITGYKKNGSPRGKVIEVLERSRSQFIAIIESLSKVSFAIPIKQNMQVDIFIPQSDLKGAKNGDRVLVEIEEWPKSAKSPIGVVKKVFNKEDGHEVEMQSILIEHGFQIEFPQRVLKAAKKISPQISEEEIKGRLDLRGKTCFTIDPLDAQDFDDAISFEALENGNFQIGVHIADVSHYVKPQSIIDQEALKRATSVYLVDRVAPMLPEVLSNRLCSLRPNEDKLCFSALFTMDAAFKIAKTWFGRTVIHSKHRFTYETAQKVLDDGKGTFSAELKWLNRLAKKLRRERFKKGAFNFEGKEYRFKLGEKGEPLGVYLKERGESHMLIEDLMLLANKKVAEYFSNQAKNLKFTYRIHDAPDAEKLSNFKNIAEAFGYKLDLSSPKAVPKAMNKLFKDVAGKPEQYLLQGLALRTMAKAEYNTQNIGHYGLAFKDYTHFTSPIRRYPDVLVHRALQELLDQRAPKMPDLEEQLNHCSKQERAAEKAERDSVKLKQMEYLEKMIGKTSMGTISGVSKTGFWVELDENFCEGYVALRDLDVGYLKFIEEQYKLENLDGGPSFQFGDRVEVKVEKVDVFARNADFSLSAFYESE